VLSYIDVLTAATTLRAFGILIFHSKLELRATGNCASHKNGHILIVIDEYCSTVGYCSLFLGIYADSQCFEEFLRSCFNIK
jgi:hypothetical protein